MEFFWHFCGFSIQQFFMKKKRYNRHYCRQCLGTQSQKRQLGACLCVWQSSWSGATAAAQEWAQARTAQNESWRQGNREGSWFQIQSAKWENKKTSYPLSLVWSWFNRVFLWNSSTILSSIYSLGDENAESSGCDSCEILHLWFNQEVRVVCCLTWLGCKYFAPELLHWSNKTEELRFQSAVRKQCEGMAPKNFTYQLHVQPIKLQCPERRSSKSMQNKKPSVKSPYLTSAGRVLPIFWWK